MKAWVLGLALASCEAAAPPVVFVSHEPGKAWWLATNAEARPRGRELGTISISALNSFLKQNFPTSPPICYLEQVDRSSIVGIDLASQLEIEESFKQLRHDPFHQLFSTSDGRKFAARVGLAEQCETGTVGAIVVIQDASNGRIESLEGTDSIFAFLWPAEVGHSITYSSCLECDVFEVLSYDVDRRRFSWESE